MEMTGRVIHVTEKMNDIQKENKFQIRNSTVDFLVFTKDSREEGIEVRVQDGDVWLTQKAIGQLFDVDRSVVTKHLKNIFSSGELDEHAVCAKFAHTAEDGKTYKTDFYNLDAIIAVGYRVNSKKATEFRIWATKVLKEYIIKGFTLNDERFIRGNKYDAKYFDELLARIKVIRTSERMAYQKITDLFIATSIDYDKKSEEAYTFFKIVQNML